MEYYYSGHDQEPRKCHQTLGRESRRYFLSLLAGPLQPKLNSPRPKWLLHRSPGGYRRYLLGDPLQLRLGTYLHDRVQSLAIQRLLSTLLHSQFHIVQLGRATVKFHQCRVVHSHQLFLPDSISFLP